MQDRVPRGVAPEGSARRASHDGRDRLPPRCRRPPGTGPWSAGLRGAIRGVEPAPLQYSPSAADQIRSMPAPMFSGAPAPGFGSRVGATWSPAAWRAGGTNGKRLF